MRRCLNNLSFRKKLILLPTAVCGVGLAVFVTIIATRTVEFARESTIQSLQETTLKKAALVRDEINAALREVSTLTALVEELQRAGTVDRELYKALLRRFMEERPHYLGAYAAWEPNALDGRDSEFAGKPDVSTRRDVPPSIRTTTAQLSLQRRNSRV